MSAQPWVLHVDLDQFLVGVELLRRPELAGRPVVVGGHAVPGERSVVSTASYEAREFGIRSGMPLKLAHRRCPEAVFLPVDFPVYQAASAQVMDTLRAWPGSVVEVLGWDEAFVGVHTDDPVRTAEQVQAAVLEATRLHSSIGIGDTLVRAKTATGFGKPQGIYRLTEQNWLQVMGARPSTALWGIGPRLAQRLAALGLQTVAQVAAAPTELLAGEFGPTNGPQMQLLSRGEGRSWPDSTPWVARAHGHEVTYPQDLSTDHVPPALHALAVRVIDDLRLEERPCARVHLKVRFAPFHTVTRVRKLDAPTFDVGIVAATATGLFTRLADARPVRLLGIRGEMVPPEGGY